MSASKLQPALLGGLLLGVLSALPIVSVCCCLWVLAGGAMAAFLLQRNQSTPISSSDGALVGLGAGVIGWAVWQLLAIPVRLLTGPFVARVTERLLQAGELPEYTRQALETMRQNAGFSILWFIAGAFVTLLLCIVFSTIGGLIGAELFRTKVVPPPPDPPPMVAP